MCGGVVFKYVWLVLCGWIGDLTCGALCSGLL
jgi:hypothetical protein